jgi:hypothetical protein
MPYQQSLVYMLSCSLVPLKEVRFSYTGIIVLVFVYENECCGAKLRRTESSDESCEIRKGFSCGRKMFCDVCEPVFETFPLSDITMTVLSSYIYCLFS